MGRRTNVFEPLNGQPRAVKLVDQVLVEAGEGRCKTDESQPGQAIAPGDRLFTIEAMMMETAVYAELGGAVEEVVSPAGTRVEAHDLVLTLMPEG